MIYHEKAGVQNTESTLKATRKRADELGIKQLVVATTTGQTALDCARVMPEMKTIVGVTMYAVDEPVIVNRPAGKIQTKDPEIMDLARAAGVTFYTGVHSLSGSTATAVSKRFGGDQAVDIISETYKTISVGTKVAVECALMAADSGLLDMNSKIISLGGWKGGVDTSIVLKPAYSRNFFDLRIIEFITLPRLDGK